MSTETIFQVVSFVETLLFAGALVYLNLQAKVLKRHQNALDCITNEKDYYRSQLDSAYERANRLNVIADSGHMLLEALGFESLWNNEYTTPDGMAVVQKHRALDCARKHVEAATEELTDTAPTKAKK